MQDAKAKLALGNSRLSCPNIPIMDPATVSPAPVGSTALDDVALKKLHEELSRIDIPARLVTTTVVEKDLDSSS